MAVSTGTPDHRQQRRSRFDIEGLLKPKIVSSSSRDLVVNEYVYASGLLSRRGPIAEYITASATPQSAPAPSSGKSTTHG